MVITMVTVRIVVTMMSMLGNVGDGYDSDGSGYNDNQC